MLRKVAASLVVIGLLAGIGAFGALSEFTSTAEVEDNVFTTGTVEISTDHPATALIFYDNMAPGDKTTEELTVSNDGSLDLRYAVTSLADDDDTKGLREQLELTIRTIDATTPLTPCDDFDGTLLYDADDLGGDPAINVIGDPAQGDDGEPTLDAGDDEVLCFQVELPLDTIDDYQDATTTATFSFVAEQTVNN